MQGASLNGSFRLFAYVYSDVSSACSSLCESDIYFKTRTTNKTPKAFANDSALNYKGNEERS